MGQASALPQWLNLIWMSLSMITLVGAGIWTIFIFYPYLKVMKEMQIEALKMGRESTDILEGMNKEMKPMIDKIDHTLSSADDLLNQANDPEKSKIITHFERTINRSMVDVREEGGKIREELQKLSGAFTKKIVAPAPQRYVMEDKTNGR